MNTPHSTSTRRLALRPVFVSCILVGALSLGLLLLSGCRKDAKQSDAKTEAAQGQADNSETSALPLPIEEAPTDLSEQETAKLSNLQVVKEHSDMELAIRGLQQDVRRARELSKIYRATGEARYKNEAHALAEKAKRLQTMIRKAERLPEGTQVSRAGDLFMELERLIAEIN